MKMSDDFSLQEATVGIVGLGLMGGSLALALKGHCRALAGSDMDPQTIQAACRQGVVDVADPEPARALTGADVVILATPVPAILDQLDALPAIVPGPCIVMDVGSAKRSIVAKMNELPGRFDPVGAHPLCGKETLSLANAEAALYRGAPFFLTPLARTTRRAMAAATQIVEAIGARAVVVDASEHDRALAMTSHLPFLLASALSLAVPAGYSKFAGPGFRSSSRLAGTSGAMMLGVLQSNRDHVLDALHDLQDELARVEKLLSEEDDQTLAGILDEARCKYEALVQ